MKPNLFIVGAPKSGTTSLRDWLGQHPDVFTLPLEPCFFCTDVGDYQYPMSLNKYEKLFVSGKNKKYLVDKSAFYLYSRVAPRRIKKYSPEAKIILITRNPKEQIRSNHQHLVADGKEYILDLEKALQAEKERKKRTNLLERYFYQDVANYKPQIERYQRIFGKKQVLILKFEEMKKDPEKVYKKMLTFLKLKYHKVDLSPRNVTSQKKRTRAPKIVVWAKRLPYSIQRIIRIIINPFRNKSSEN